MWLRKVFIPETKPAEGEKRILIIAGHKSYITEECKLECFNNGIHLIFSVAGDCHVFQPLDVAVFSQVKKAYRK